jgi:hypothetical protein
MEFIIINIKTLEVMTGADGLPYTYSERDEAVETLEALARIHEFAEFRLMTWSEFNRSLERRSVSFEGRSDRLAHLESVITQYLEEGIEGNTELDEFIEQTQALAEAVGFEFVTEEELSITVHFTAKVKRGYEPKVEDFDISLDTYEGEIKDINVTGQEFAY